MYYIDDLLGKGTFGQVVRCQKRNDKQLYAIKVIKSKPAYCIQAKTEIELLNLLNKHDTKQRIIKMRSCFIHQKHFCIVFELLDMTLYDLIRSYCYTGFSFPMISHWTKQILEGLIVAEELKVIHCDLKPENIMLKKNSNDIKIIDFGSACKQDKKIYTYIQSRFYRAPEVILQMPYTTAIDIWSLGCIVVELFLGLPIFPGNSEYDQIKRIIDILGQPEDFIIQKGRGWHKYFRRVDNKF